MESCKNITIRLPCIAGFLCRAIIRGCAEIEIFGDIFTSESAEGVALDTTGTGGALVEEAITVTVVAGADTGEVAEEVEFVTTDAVVDRVGEEITAVAAARLEAW